ncbi:MAG: primosomal protein N' [Candidatus Saccharibacteria bacterium]
MYFYEVLVSSPAFHGKEPLTYQSEVMLPAGVIVVVALRNTPVVGVVLRSIPKPTFTTKSVNKVVTKALVPAATLELLDWLRYYYPSPLGILAQILLPSSLLRKRDLAEATLPRAVSKSIKLPPLIPEQKAAVKLMTSPGPQSYLLHGDTGSGKTRVYLEMALKSLGKGRSVLLLTPEIGLTPQLEARVREALAYPVIVVHSQLTPAERRNVWLQVLQAEGPIVVIGPRSALFAPIKNLGLIVVDEAHDQAYKQEQAPYYHALRVAGQLAHIHKAKLILGSATPTIAEYALAKAKKIPIIRLVEKPAGKNTEKQISLVDLKDREQFGSNPHLSSLLLGEMQKTLNNKSQILILLNRRGTARLMLCQSCGWQALCPNCDLPLTYHADKHRLQCHTCGHTARVTSSCPDCHGTELIFKGIGTKSLTDELRKAFPDARIQRFDTDNVKAERLEQHFPAIANGDVDILVGTQMLAKGLDLPNLTLVGVVVADTNLYFPDYTAEEQTYQLLTQVIGRVGRGHKAGTVVIQSYSPKSTAIQAALNQDWDSFYAQQIDERQIYGFPPFYHTLKLSCTRATSASAQTTAQKLADSLRHSGLRIEIIGPAPSFYERVGGKYRWQLIIKAKQRGELLKVLNLLPANWTHDLDPLNLL